VSAGTHQGTTPAGQADSRTAGTAAAFEIAGWRVEPETGRISRADTTVHLEPKVMGVLMHLAQRPGKLVTREELEASVWAGTVVGYDAVTGAVVKLRKALQDSPRAPRIIETLSKRGYRLLAPVTPVRAAPAPALPGEKGKARAVSDSTRRRLLPAFVGSLAAAGAVAAWLGWRGLDEHERDAAQPAATIAVLPLENLGGDPAQQYFADGIAYDLLTDLTGLSGLVVISRDSTFAYRTGATDLRSVASELGARYILHGSVRRAGEQLRLNIVLTDSESGRQLWAERYDGRVDDVFQVQDEITQKIVAALAVTLTDAEHRRLAREDTHSVQAYERFLKGEELFFRYARASNAEARALFKEAIELDERYARAYAMLAWTHAFDFMNGWSDAPPRSLEQGERLATRALTLNDNLPIAYFVRGLVYRERGEYVKALVEAERAVATDPSYANGHILYSTLLYYAGRPREGLERVRKAIRLNPHHPSNYPFHLGQAYFVLANYDAAITAFRQGLVQNPTSERLRVWLAAAYAQAGRVEDARWELDQVRLVNPDFSLERIHGIFPFTDPEDLRRFLDGLRLAGLAG
jgi:TolB-like protein/DNA-binding winged helix-turn-helix (wHTH) protein